MATQAASSATPLQTVLREHGVRRPVRRGEALFSEGDVGERVFLLEAGWVLIRSAAPDGDDVVLALRGAGEILGELSVLDGRARSATAIALTTGEVVATPGAALHAALERDTDAARELLLVLCERLREADRRRLEYAKLDTLGRVASRLLDLAERFGVQTADGTRVELPLVQDDIARWCGGSREATVKALRTLRGLGVVTTGRRTVTIHDDAALRQMARGLA